MDEPGLPQEQNKANICSGCWEGLPVSCFCGAVGMCSQCADILSMSDFFSADGLPNVAADIKAVMDNLVATVRANAYRFAS